ncbi:MAG: ChaN family lipoprotein [Pseudomonadota bacterium]|nr:ChaN family lipoprotein [Pseudomonadota bacterium]
MHDRPALIASLLLALLLVSGGTRSQALLLGEVHDNPDAHSGAYALLEQRVQAGWRPVIAMEQFDRERQADLDRALAECTDAKCVVDMAAPADAGWNWDFYAPVIELALREKLPLLAANLSRADADKVVSGGFSAALDPMVIGGYALEDSLPASVLASQVEEVREGHCNALPADALEPMAKAQIARDIVMTEIINAHADNIVLIAGNGHVRTDIGVPYWLRSLGINAQSIGFVEDAGKEAQFDEVHQVPVAPRADPCEKFRAAQ